MLTVIIFSWVGARLGMSARGRLTVRQLGTFDAVAQVVSINPSVFTRMADCFSHVVNGICAEEIVLTVEEPHVRLLVHDTCWKLGGFPLAHNTLVGLSMDPIVPPPVTVQSNASFMKSEIVMVQTIIRNAECIWVVPCTSIFPGPCAEFVRIWALRAKGANVHAGPTGNVNDSIVVVKGMDARKFATVVFAPVSALVNVITKMPVDKVTL